jgi:hypothetical protein
MMAAHAQQAAHDAAGAGAGDGSASSGGVTLHASEAAPPALPEAAAAAAAAPGARGQGGAAAGSSDALVPVVGAGEAISLLSGGLLQLAGAAQARATEGFEGLRDWLVESLAALVQVRCGVGARVPAQGAAAAVCMRACMPTQPAARQAAGGLPAPTAPRHDAPACPARRAAA